ncbi:hypothetical protein JCM16303_000094 [Sporobolomyces ruberrimus]
MVHLHSVVLATSVVLSSLAPGAQAAPAMPPLPMRQEARRSMLNSGDLDLEKRDLKIKSCFDPDHSLHWNYHHGCASEDGHGHGWHGAKERRTIDLEAIIQLNSKAPKSKRGLLGLDLGGNADTNARASSNLGLGGILGGKNGALIGGKNGIGLNLKAKRGEEAHDEEDFDEESELEKRDPRSSRHRHRHGHRHDHDHYDSHDHVHIHSHKRDEIEARAPRRHHRHSSDHDHEHIHEHYHKRDEIEESDDLEKRSKSTPKRFERKSKKSKGKKSSSKSAKSYKKKSDSMKDSSKKKSSSSKKNNNKENKDSESKPAVAAKVSLGKRALEQAGVPGFVEVATPLFNSSLARTVAGLVFTANPDPSPNATTFVLGTSDAESTQFYLTTASNPDPSTPVELNVVNIRVPILDSQTLKVVDYCATFDLTPPSPLSLLPCGKKDGFSQNFAYNGTTGEIQPLYSTTPAPMALVSNKASQQASSSAQSFAATDSNSTSTAQPEEDEQPEDISLYFIPASTYYEAPADVNHLIDSHKNRTLAASMSTDGSSDEMTPTSTMMDPASTSTDLPSTATDSSSAPDATMTAAPVDASYSDDSNMDDSMDDSMDGSDSMSMTDDSSATPTDSMTDDSYPTATDSTFSDEPLSTSTMESAPSSTPLVNQNNAATPSSSMMASSSSSSSPSAVPTSSSSAPLSSMTPSASGTPSSVASDSMMMSSSSTSSSASASPTVTILQTTDYTTPGMASDPNAGVDANASNYSPMARRRFARW